MTTSYIEVARERNQQDADLMPIAQDFKTGDLVTYVPHHANGDLAHPDVEHGRVTSENGIFVFVRFDGEIHTKACHPATLRHQWMPSELPARNSSEAK